MPIFDNVEARIVVDGENLTEYSEPNSNDFDDDVIVRYVEAIPGQKFTLKTKILPGYQHLGGSYLCSQIFLDETKKSYKTSQQPADVDRSRGRWYRLTRAIKFDMKHVRGIDGSGSWRKWPLAFGTLGFDEDSPDDSINPEHVQQLGRIRIIVFRATKKKRKTPRHYDGSLPAVKEKISEKLLKRQDVQHYVNYLPSDVAAEPYPTTSYKIVPVRGPNGTKLVFEFRYRSRKALQNLGCIPRTPSPEPDLSAILKQQEETMSLMKERERKTNLELLKLRQELQNQNQRLSKFLGNTGSDAGTTGPKRLADDEDDKLREVSPRKKPRVVIDLLDDE